MRRGSRSLVEMALRRASLGRPQAAARRVKKPSRRR